MLCSVNLVLGGLKLEHVSESCVALCSVNLVLGVKLEHVSEPCVALCSVNLVLGGGAIPKTNEI